MRLEEQVRVEWEAIRMETSSGSKLGLDLRLNVLLQIRRERGCQGQDREGWALAAPWIAPSLSTVLTP